MRQTLRLGAVAAALIVAGLFAVPWVWRHAFPAPESEEELPATAADLAMTIDAVNLAVAAGLGELGVVPEQIVATDEEPRERDGFGWTFTRSTLDLPEGVSDGAIRAAFARWPEGVEAFLTRPDELTYSLRVYAGKVPVMRLLLRLPLDPDPQVDADAPPRLAVVIKGVGPRSAEVERILELETPLTVAIQPYHSHSLRYANDAARASKEVVAHLDLGRRASAVSGTGTALPVPLGSLSEPDAFRARLAEDIEAVPFSSGVLACSRSAAARDGERMGALADTLASGGLYLLDDTQYPEGVALQEARRASVSARSVTAALAPGLDGEEHGRALLRLRNLAVLRGQALLTAQLGPGDAARLFRFVEDRRKEGYQLVFVSEIVGESDGSTDGR